MLGVNGGGEMISSGGVIMGLMVMCGSGGGVESIGAAVGDIGMGAVC